MNAPLPLHGFQRMQRRPGDTFDGHEHRAICHCGFVTKWHPSDAGARMELADHEERP